MQQIDSSSSGVLVLNPGSTTLKWAWFKTVNAVNSEHQGQCGVTDSYKLLKDLLIQHPAVIYVIRFVHGGARFSKPILVKDTILLELQATVELAPLHNQTSLDCLTVVKSISKENCQIVAAFDTEFFHSLPDEAQSYGLPMELTRKYSIRRYGFHGFAHRAMSDQWSLLAQKNANEVSGSRLVTMQLGSGCSMAAIRDGKPVDTTMGFTPNDGLLMSTRSGEIDPGLVTFLQRHELWTPEQTDQMLNQSGGWLGISAESASMEELLQSSSSSARLSIRLFQWRIRKTLGAYYAILGGLDAVILSGGVAEHAPGFCQELLQALEHLGIKLDNSKSYQGVKANRGSVCLNLKGSAVSVWVVPNNESVTMLKSLRESDLLC